MPMIRVSAGPDFAPMSPPVVDFDTGSVDLWRFRCGVAQVNSCPGAAISQEFQTWMAGYFGLDGDGGPAGHTKIAVNRRPNPRAPVPCDLQNNP
ncbi:hypothetical protein Psi02_71230 [Planotetraspora silvatica]|uniref:Uncharacterized protein n=1 Tax=Planotetraspora silvatica TaxID=234614 RepID=A0A8J3UYD5_9ACTN|nr:hypothetical protein Psi02_71230 [Planotetraspora silvatica]